MQVRYARPYNYYKSMHFCFDDQIARSITIDHVRAAVMTPVSWSIASAFSRKLVNEFQIEGLAAHCKFLRCSLNARLQSGLSFSLSLSCSRVQGQNLVSRQGRAHLWRSIQSGADVTVRQTIHAFRWSTPPLPNPRSSISKFARVKVCRSCSPRKFSPGYLNSNAWLSDGMERSVATLATARPACRGNLDIVATWRAGSFWEDQAKDLDMDERLFSCHHRRPDASVRLICFPWAGGKSSYFSREWGAKFPPWIEGKSGLLYLFC